MTGVSYINFSDDPHGVAINVDVQLSIENYLCYGLPPGGFLTSVFANDLLSAVTRADAWNKNAIVPIAKWVFYNTPILSHGSYKNVQDWIDDVNGRRSLYFEQLSKNLMWKVLQTK